MASTWISYNDLAWTENLIAKIEDYKNEAIIHIDMINKYSSNLPNSLLHLGSGAGGHDTYFKKHFHVTGVDLSKGMLELARERHPEIEYIEGDMRTIRLNRKFDAVVIPDSIDYLVSENDLFQAIETGAIHLNKGGVLLVAAKPKETFRNNNFAYSGGNEDLNVTVLENNFINTFKPGTYEATLIYLIRQNGELSTFVENQVLGLFPLKTWERIFKETGFELFKESLSGIYDKFLLNDGEYPITVFIGRKIE